MDLSGMKAAAREELSCGGGSSLSGSVSRAPYHIRCHEPTAAELPVNNDKQRPRYPRRIILSSHHLCLCATLTSYLIHTHALCITLLTHIHTTQLQATKAKGSPKAKKPLSGYMLFAKEMRPKLKEESPDLSFGEVGKELGARWRALSDNEKAKYKK